MAVFRYFIFILLFAGSGNSNCGSLNECNNENERLKRSVTTISDKTFKKVIVYNDAITTLSTSTWPRYVSHY